MQHPPHIRRHHAIAKLRVRRIGITALFAYKGFWMAAEREFKRLNIFEL